MTPAEQYRTLVNRLESILEDQPAPDTDPGELPGWEDPPEYQPLTPIPPPAGAYHTATAGSSPHAQDPAQVQQGMAQLQRRCQSLLYRLSQAAGAYDQQIMSKIAIRVTDDPEDDLYSIVSYSEINVDYSQWNDAPDSVLLWSLGHEAGHICMTHRIKGNTPYQLQQQELAADAFATRLCLGMGITAAPAFKWANDKRDRLSKTSSPGSLHQYKLDTMANPNTDSNQQSSHPTYQQRFDAARQQGFELGRADTDQLDRFLQHMSRTA